VEHHLRHHGAADAAAARQDGTQAGGRRSGAARSRGLDPGARGVIEHFKAFLKHLALNRNLSAHTVRAYESDLSQFLGHVAAKNECKRPGIAPEMLDRLAIRSFLADLHAAGQTRATAARKLAAVRTFLRYLRREGVIASDPGALTRTPKRDVRM